MSLLIGRLYQVPQTGSLNRRHSGSRLEAGSETRVSQGRFLPRPLSGACVEGRPLPVSPHSRPSVRVCVLMSSSGAVPCHKALDSTPGTSCDRCHLFHDPISTGSHFLRSWGSARPPVTVGDTVRPSHPPQCPWLTGAQSHQRPPFRANIPPHSCCPRGRRTGRSWSGGGSWLTQRTQPSEGERVRERVCRLTPTGCPCPDLHVRVLLSLPRARAPCTWASPRAAKPGSWCEDATRGQLAAAPLPRPRASSD